MNRQEIALSNLENDRIYGRKAIAYRGGEISADAGFYEIVHKIPTLPMTSTGTWIDDTISNFKIVPEDSISHCYLKSLGGMTYKKNNNVMPFPYVGPDGSMDVGSVLQYGGFTISVTSDKSLAISRSYEIVDDTVTLDVNVPSDDYYLTVTHIGDNFFDVSSNVGNIPFNTPVFIPKETGITYINIHGAPESEGSATISLLLTKEPNYREYLSDNKPTAIKVHGANLLDIEAAFRYWGMSIEKDGNRYTTTSSLGLGYNKPYKFTDNPQVCTMSVTSASQSGWTNPRIELGYLGDDGSFTGRVSLNLGSNTTITSTGAVNAIRTNYSSVTDSSRSVTIDEIRINYGSIDCGFTPYQEPITYPIPEALQGTGKGVEGASDTVDFEDGEKIIKTHTVVFNGTENWKYLSNWGTVTMKSPSFLPKKGVANNRIITNAPMSCVFADSNYDRLRFGNIDNNSNDPIEKYGIYSVEDWINYLQTRYAGGDPITVTYEIAEPTKTDIDILDPTVSGFVNLLNVQGGGAIEIITDNGGNIPTTIIFQIIS